MIRFLKCKLGFVFFLVSLTLLLHFYFWPWYLVFHILFYSVLFSLHWRRVADGFQWEFQCSDLPRCQPLPSCFPSSHSHPHSLLSQEIRAVRGALLSHSWALFWSFVFSRLCSVPIASVSICGHLLLLLFGDFPPVFPLVQHICFWFWTWGDYLCEQEDLC